MKGEIMSVIKELIKASSNGGLDFGNYELAEKTKKSDFEFKGDIYKVKTYKDITKLERNEMFVYESVPGTTVLDFKASAQEISFKVEGDKAAQATLELESDKEYNVFIDGAYAGIMKTNLGGKISLSLDLEEGKTSEVLIKKQ